MNLKRWANFPLEKVFPRTANALASALPWCMCVVGLLFTVGAAAMAYWLLSIVVAVWRTGMYPGPGIEHVHGLVACGICFIALAACGGVFIAGTVRRALRANSPARRSEGERSSIVPGG